MSKDDPIEDEVLLAYAVELTHNLATLERYLRRYPQFAQSLIDCSIELEFCLPTEGLAEKAPATARHWDLFQTSMGRATPALSDPFRRLSSQAFRSVAAELGMNVLLMMRLRDRVIRATTIPPALIRMLADKLGVSDAAMGGYLREAPVLAAEGVQFKSPDKPAVAPQIDFADAVRASQLTDEQQKFLLALGE